MKSIFLPPSRLLVLTQRKGSNNFTISDGSRTHRGDFSTGDRKKLGQLEIAKPRCFPKSGENTLHFPFIFPRKCFVDSRNPLPISFGKIETFQLYALLTDFQNLRLN